MDLSFIFISIFSAIIGVVISTILTDEGMILRPIYDLFLKLNVPLWIMKPTISCSYCIAGQWSLWTYIIYSNKYSFIEHIFCIVTAIFIVDLLIRKLL